jgi:hypothetical protein
MQKKQALSLFGMRAGGGAALRNDATERMAGRRIATEPDRF